MMENYRKLQGWIRNESRDSDANVSLFTTTILKRERGREKSFHLNSCFLDTLKGLRHSILTIKQVPVLKCINFKVNPHEVVAIVSQFPPSSFPL